MWIYTRLSNDDDPERDSLQNQERICREFAVQRGDHIAGLSSDDNISGMNFSRRGLSRLTAAVEAGGLDGVVVKDLSRLGRHRTQTALFIDYLRERGVRVLSATERLDTFREEDDLIIGVRGLMNDYYAKDTGEIKIQPEAAETVRSIYALYLEGCGQREIARQLNGLGRKTPAQLRAEHCGREVRAAHKTQDGKYLWTYASVKNILVEESYTGVLVNHRSETNSGKVKWLSPNEWYRHEGFFPVIVSKKQWEAVQQRLKEQARPANGNKTKHRYAGLLTCRECGNPFVPMIRYWNGKKRVEYVCRGYHRNGKSYCTSHRIHEEVLNTMVWEYLTAVRDSRIKEREELVKLQKMWALRKPILDAHILSLQKRILQLEREIDEIIIEKIGATDISPHIANW